MIVRCTSDALLKDFKELGSVAFCSWNMELTCQVITVEGTILNFLYALLDSELLVSSWQEDLHIIQE